MTGLTGAFANLPNETPADTDLSFNTALDNLAPAGMLYGSVREDPCAIDLSFMHGSSLLKEVFDCVSFDTCQLNCITISPAWIHTKHLNERHQTILDMAVPYLGSDLLSHTWIKTAAVSNEPAFDHNCSTQNKLEPQ